MIKTILKANAEVFILVRGYQSSHSGFPFSPRTKVDTKEGVGPGQWYKENFGYKFFRSLGLDYRAICDDTADCLSPTREKNRITQ